MSDYSGIYSAQIVMLLLCIPIAGLSIYMVWHARLALNGLARGLILLLSMLIVLVALLIVQRLDDMQDVLTPEMTAILSSAVALLMLAVIIVVLVDVSYLYRQREFYTTWRAARQAKETQLENMRKASEARKRWDDETLRLL